MCPDDQIEFLQASDLRVKDLLLIKGKVCKVRGPWWPIVPPLQNAWLSNSRAHAGCTNKPQGKREGGGGGTTAADSVAVQNVRSVPLPLPALGVPLSLLLPSGLLTPPSLPFFV